MCEWETKSYSSCTFLWLSGWSVHAQIWDEQVARWPEGRHLQVDFTGCTQLGQLFPLVEKALFSLSSSSTPVIIVGWSMGAMLALELAAKHPDLVCALFLVGATGQFVRSDEAPHGAHERLLRRMRSQLTLDREEVLRAFDKSMFSKSEVSLGLDQIWAKDRADQVPTSIQSLEIGLDYLSQYKMYPQLESIRTPTFLLNGHADIICSSQGALQLFESLSTCECTIWEEAGHVPFWTEQERFYKWMQERFYKWMQERISHGHT
ncbi:alpha/beta fold hydrolase [Paenibacillus sp. KN14-4R]|uniref:alpha/beta fold hydrolase n=1 Tax=Paenibacillus sp. KN14-4R TaxID=3445773 RepID=UPI003FA09C28